MLDRDLDMQARVASDLKISGTAVVQEIITHLHRDIPILVHSMNPSGAPRMVSQLQSAGFVVTRLSWFEMEMDTFHEWLEELRQNWEISWGEE